MIEESIVSFARPKWWLQKAAAEKLQRCAQASSRRGRRSTPSQPAQSLPCSGLVGCSLSCARARHAEAGRSGRRQRRRIGRMLGRRAGRRGPAGSGWARLRAVRGRSVLCASRPSHGTGRWRVYVCVVCARGRPGRRARGARLKRHGGHGRRVDGRARPKRGLANFAQNTVHFNRPIAEACGA